MIEKCSRIVPPEGWEWQECDRKNVALVRTRTKQWKYKTGITPKDVVITAKKVEQDWDVNDWDPDFKDWLLGLSFDTKRVAVREMKCKAIERDALENDYPLAKERYGAVIADQLVDMAVSECRQKFRSRSGKNLDI